MTYPGFMAPTRGSRTSPKDKSATRGSGSSGRLVDGITQQLREMILDHRIAPGTVMIQTEWSERLKVSRTPLREAFRILEQDGLVRASNGNRTIQVVRFSAGELRDLYEVREVVDGLAARLLADRGLPEGLEQELAGLLAVMANSADPFEPAAWFSAHMAFHLRIAEMCGNSRVRQQLDLIKMTSFSLHAYLADLSVSGDRLGQVLDVADRQHRSILDALRSGSGDLAEMAACRHIGTTLRSDLIARATDAAGRRAG